MWKFDNELQQKEFNATGRNCGNGMWSFDVYNRHKNNNTMKLITSEKVRNHRKYLQLKNYSMIIFEVLLDGVGAIAMFVGDDMRPWFASRIGVLCLFGTCGSRG